MIGDELARLIKNGYGALGELEFAESSSGYLLYHWADRNSLPEMRVYRSIEDARQIAKYDSGGAYRPLKGAPNLPRGWLIELSNIETLKRALDDFYPGAICYLAGLPGRNSAPDLFTTNSASTKRNVSSHPTSNQ